MDLRPHSATRCLRGSRKSLRLSGPPLGMTGAEWALLRARGGRSAQCEGSELVAALIRNTSQTTRNDTGTVPECLHSLRKHPAHLIRLSC